MGDAVPGGLAFGEGQAVQMGGGGGGDGAAKVHEEGLDPNGKPGEGN